MMDDNRIVIFMTKKNLEHFINYKIAVCDGTFKSSLSKFEKFLVFNVMRALDKNLGLFIKII